MDYWKKEKEITDNTIQFANSKNQKNQTSLNEMSQRLAIHQRFEMFADPACLEFALTEAQE